MLGKCTNAIDKQTRDKTFETIGTSSTDESVEATLHHRINQREDHQINRCSHQLNSSLCKTNEWFCGHYDTPPNH